MSVIRVMKHASCEDSLHEALFAKKPRLNFGEIQ